MGNCLAKCAFKEEEMKEEPKIVKNSQKPRANIKKTLSRENTADKSTKGHTDETGSFYDDAIRGYDRFDDIFEPRPFHANAINQAVSVSKTVEVKLYAGPIHSGEEAGTAMQGVLNALTDLKLELNKRTGWLEETTVDEKEVSKQEQKMKSEVPKQEQKMTSEVPKHRLNMPLEVPKYGQLMPLQFPEQPKYMPSSQIAKKTPKRDFRKRQPKAKKRRISFNKVADSSDEEASNAINSDWLSGSDVGGFSQPPVQANLNVPKRKSRNVKSSSSFHQVKSHNRFKNIINKRNQQAAIKHQIRCAPIKIKAE